MFKYVPKTLPNHLFYEGSKWSKLALNVNLFRQLFKYRCYARQSSYVLLILDKVGSSQEGIGNTNGSSFCVFCYESILW